MSEPAITDPQALLTAEQVAQRLGVTIGWVYSRSRSGQIPTVTLGRYRRYRSEAIEAWVRELARTSPLSVRGPRPSR